MNPQLSTYKIKDWVVLGRTFFKPPFKFSDTLINEARIVHVVCGHSKLYAANQYTEVNAGDTVIMKSDNFINDWLENQSGDLNEIIVFQLTSDMLKQVYQQQLPDWFSNDQTKHVFPTRKAESNLLLTDYFQNLKHYLDKPQLISEDILRIKIKELIHVLVKTDSSGNNQKIFGSLFKANEYKYSPKITYN